MTAIQTQDRYVDEFGFDAASSRASTEGAHQDVNPYYESRDLTSQHDCQQGYTASQPCQSYPTLPTLVTPASSWSASQSQVAPSAYQAQASFGGHGGYGASQYAASEQLYQPLPAIKMPHLPTIDANAFTIPQVAPPTNFVPKHLYNPNDILPFSFFQQQQPRQLAIPLLPPPLTEDDDIQAQRQRLPSRARANASKALEKAAKAKVRATKPEKKAEVKLAWEKNGKIMEVERKKDETEKIKAGRKPKLSE